MTTAAASRTVSLELRNAIDSYQNPRGFLAAASIGLPPLESAQAMREDLDLWSAAQRDPQDYDAIIERTRASYATLVGVSPERVATGSQTSVLTSLIAAAVPDGAEVLCVDGDFSSIMFPFLQRPGIVVRTVPLSALADSIADATWMVVFSHIQSSTGAVADVEAVTTAAVAHDAFTFCDTTQSAGVHPVDASVFDVTVCHAYKWLCSPRGVAFMTLSPTLQERLTPLQAGWYAGEDPWLSCYGPQMELADSARRFDVSPAWQAWVGAEPAIRMFAGLDMDEVWAWTSGTGDQLCDTLGIPQQHQAIVTWTDPDRTDLTKLTGAGIRASGRAGRLRASFHIWNDERDVEAVARALR